MQGQGAEPPAVLKRWLKETWLTPHWTRRRERLLRRTNLSTPSFDPYQFSHRRAATISALQLRFPVIGQVHSQMKFARIKSDDLKGERTVIHASMGENVRIVADYMRLAAVSGNHVEDDGSFEVSGVAAQRHSDPGLAVQFALPYTDPLLVISGFRRERPVERERAECHEKHPVFHVSSSLGI
jgi:hypothetical protein